MLVVVEASAVVVRFGCKYKCGSTKTQMLPYWLWAVVASTLTVVVLLLVSLETTAKYKCPRSCRCFVLREVNVVNDGCCRGSKVCIWLLLWLDDE